MRPHLWSLLALLATAALGSCLADIPELSGGTGAGAAGTTAATTSAASTATGWCDGVTPPVDFCADFDDVADVAEGWSPPELKSFGHIELATDRSTSAPRAMHAWVEDGIGGQGTGPYCEYAQLEKVFDDDPLPVVEAAFQVQRVGDFGIVASILYAPESPPSTSCAILVRYRDDGIHVSVQHNPGMASQGVTFPFPVEFQLTDVWHSLKLTWDRGSAASSMAVELDGTAMDPEGEIDLEQWWAECNKVDIPGPLTFSIGSYCINPPSDPPTDAYFDDVTFDFKDAP